MLPVAPMERPSVLDGQSNGRLDADILEKVPGQQGGYGVLLVKPAARAWRAFSAAALAAGHVLKVGFTTASYRPYADQERIFRSRYYPDPAGRRWWQGEPWRKRSGVAAAAVPGTSNHGWGLAVDVGEERDGDSGAESLDQATLEWMVDHAHRYGFSWELQSEPWHIRYVAGDEIPTAVLDHESGQSEEDDMNRLITYHDPIRNRAQVVDHAGQKVREIDDVADWIKSWRGPIEEKGYLSDVVDDFGYEKVN